MPLTPAPFLLALLTGGTTHGASPSDPTDGPTIAAQEKPDAATVLAKVDEVSLAGWKQKRLRAVSMSGEVSVPGMETGGEFRESYDGAGRAQWITTYPGMGTGIIGTDGTRSWSVDPVMGVSVEEGVRHGNVRRMLGLSARSAWKTLYKSAKMVGERKIDERPHWELEMIPAEGKPDRWCIDQETHLVTQLSTALPDPNGGWIPMQMHYSAFKLIDGVPYPMKKSQRIGDFVVEFEYQKVEHSESLPEDQLGPPESVLAAMENPETQTPKFEEGIRLRDLEERHVATIRMKVKATEVSKGLAIMLPEVMGYITEHGVVPAGAPFSRYHGLDDGFLDIEAGIPVAEPIEGNERVKASKLPGGRIACTWHIGPYHELDRSYDRLKAWIEEQDLETDGGQWEVYWTDPGLEPNPEKWRTEVLWPVKDG